jgi:hypothetical protein
MIPVITTPTFEVEVLSTKQKIRCRPFLVKEEKILVMAQEQNDKKEILNAMQDIVTACSNGAVNGHTLPIFDLQNLFLRIRSQSIGGTSDFNLICGECGHRTPFTLNLDAIQLQTNEEHTNKIMLTDTVGVVMKYPTPEDTVSDELKVFDLVVNCVDQIFDEQQVYSTADESKEEIEKFIDSLTSEQFERIAKFFETMPKLEHTVDYTCSNCSKENIVFMDGLESFFG